MHSPAISAALRRFQIIAYTVGTFLILLVPIGMPLKYFADVPEVVGFVGPMHGFGYMVYLALTIDLARRVQWPFARTVLVMLAGTVPFLSFVAERKVTHELGTRTPAPEKSAVG